MKIIINTCFGGFSLSHKAFLQLREMGNKYALEEPDWGEFYSDGSGPRRKYGGERGSFLRDIPRGDPDLIKVSELLGAEASGSLASLKVVEIPDGVDWEIDEYDGLEHIAERHRTWY